MSKQKWLRRLRVVAAAGACLLFAQNGSASSFQVNPVLIKVDVDKTAAIVVVTNGDSQPLSVRIRAFAWTQDGGSDRYAETPDMLVSPPIATIPAGKSQIVRVGPRQRGRIGERAYRLVVEEIPAARSGQQTVRMALRFDVPMYVLAPGKGMPDLHWNAWRSANGKIVVEAKNTGPVHADVLGLGWLPEAGKSAMLNGRIGAVLANSSKRWTLLDRSPLPIGSVLTLIIRTASGEIHSRVTLQSL